MNRPTFIFLIFVLSACTFVESTPVIMPTDSSSVLTSIVTPTPTSATPNVPKTLTEAPPAEVKLVRLVEKLENFPLLTPAQELEHIQKAKDTRTLFQTPDDIWHIQISQFTYNDIVFGDGVRIGCGINKSCLIRDSYQIQGVHKVLMELYVTFKDGSQGAVIVSIIIDSELFDYPAANPDELTTYRLLSLMKSQSSPTGTIDKLHFITSTKSNSRQPTSPVIKNILDAALNDAITKDLLQKAHDLAKEGKFLSQSEIDQLLNAILWY